MVRTSLPPKKELLKWWATRSWRAKSLKEGTKSKSVLLRITPDFHIVLKELAHIYQMTLQDFIFQCCQREISGIVRKNGRKKAKR
jgi:uncharacterized protein (DUF1778 family)